MDQINHDRAEMVYNQLNLSMEEFKELYNRYHQYGELNTEAEVAVQEMEQKYLKEVEEAYSAVVKLYVNYKKAL